MKRILIATLVLTAIAIVANPSSGVSAAAIKSLSGCTANTLAANDDGSTDAVALPFTPNFFGTTYGALFVNNNGNVTFDSSLSNFTPFDLTSTSTVIIAPFFGDVDTRGAASGLVTYGDSTFGGRAAFCVNWVNVGYYASRTDKLNSFQLLLVDRSDVGAGDFDIMFNYDQIQWETGEASDGTDGLGGSSARVGYSNGIDTSLELPGSAVNGAFLDSSPAGLRNNSRNSLETGRYVFPVRSGTAPVGGSISGTVFGESNGAGGPAGSAILAGALVQNCQIGGGCTTTTTNSLGQYIFTGLGGGVNYVVTAFPPAGSSQGPRSIGALFLAEGANLIDQDIVLLFPVPVPPNVTFSSPGNAPDGTPVIFSDRSTPLTQTGSCTGGIATWSLIQGGVVIDSGPMVESPPGTYSATVPAQGSSRAGRADFKISIDCPGATPDKQTTFDIYIDPSGYVRDVSGNPIAGATVTLSRSDSSSGPFDVVPNGSAIMSPSNRTNPDTTDAEGHFGWDVIAGFYVVRAEAAGCVSPDNPAQAFVETEVMTIPPPVTDLDIRLDCGAGPPPSPPTVRIGSLSLEVGAQASLSLETQSISSPGLLIWTVDVGYDGGVVTVTDCAPMHGGVCNPDLAGSSTARVTGVSDPPLLGDLVLASIQFRCDGTGTSPLVITLATFAGPPSGDPQPIAALTANGQLTCTPSAPTGSGDANCDGMVNSIDAALVLQLIAGLVPSLSCEDDADVNENGDVNSIDVAIILQFVAGLIPTLPV